MGGNGSGGLRIGSGAKPDDERSRSLRGRQRRTRLASPAPAELARDLTQPPSELSNAEKRIWLELAPHAVAAGTLTVATAGDFCTLVQLTIEAAELLAARRVAGWTDEGRALSTAYRQVVLRQEAKLRGFQLAPIGKPMSHGMPLEESSDPFAEFDTPPVPRSFRAVAMGRKE